MCIVKYPYGGNGPWNYIYERAPAGTAYVGYVGVYLGRTDRHHLSCNDFAIMGDGSMEPVHVKHWDIGMDITIVDMPTADEASQEGKAG